MLDLDYCRDKLSQYKIGGPSKPFIDQNLQMQLPEWDSQPKPSSYSPSPIYSHYVGSSPSSYLASVVNEAEIAYAMAEATNAYQTWKNQLQRIKEILQSYQSRR